MDAHVLLYTRIVGFLQSVDGRGESEKPSWIILNLMGDKNEKSRQGEGVYVSNFGEIYILFIGNVESETQ